MVCYFFLGDFKFDEFVRLESDFFKSNFILDLESLNSKTRSSYILYYIKVFSML